MIYVIVSVIPIRIVYAIGDRSIGGGHESGIQNFALLELSTDYRWTRAQST